MYLSFDVSGDILKGLKSIHDFSSPKQIYNDVLTLYLESKGNLDMAIHPLCRLEYYVWAKVFLDGYINLWDSSDNHEFILSDNGMSTEYEPSHIVFNGLSLSKTSYLSSKLSTATKPKMKFIYLDLLHKCQIQFENFSLFSISSSRILVLIIPFFRLYSKDAFTDSKEKLLFPKPKVWPSFIDSRQAFKYRKISILQKVNSQKTISLYTNHIK